MLQTILLLIGAMIVLLLAFVIAISGDKKDQQTLNVQSTAEWIDSSRISTCSAMSGTGVVTEVEQAFREIQKLLGIWDDLYGKNPELQSEQKDVQSLFEIVIRDIQRICSDFKKSRLTKAEFSAELDGQIAQLNDLLRCLASAARSRSASFV